ncbi:hypothetical protein [Streptomyces sp. NPDC094472]|uniref:hypothetical protein n=1 Tax=unclassified Streptomyces TaxID=2593676 RepID=UPI003319103E
MNADHPSFRPRTRRFGALAIAASALVLATASPALAHTEVSDSDSHALAKNVTLTFESESENPAPLLKPAAAGAAPSASPSASPRPENHTPDSDGKSPLKAATSDDGSPWPAVGVIIGVCLVALAGGFVLFQQRRGAGTE